ncbi:unnamed protein product [Schistocephalus solidus]|uniref:COMM domain-containing protein n=1 Tax=Schistocephalus solidus TaxID=70667 RepID=A0A183STR3_SCHSO|nr:unnamed protein product [Schistocephalus solidus]
MDRSSSRPLQDEATSTAAVPAVKWTAPVISAFLATLLTDETQILKRCVEHFRSALNRPSTISDTVIDRLPKMEINADLDLVSFLQNTITAVQQVSSGKSTGSDAIPTSPDTTVELWDTTNDGTAVAWVLAVLPAPQSSGQFSISSLVVQKLKLYSHTSEAAGEVMAFVKSRRESVVSAAGGVDTGVEID